MSDRTELAFRAAARPLIPRGASVLVAVSGGGDSVALLHLLLRLAAGQDWSLRVAHLDHGLRRGSRADRRFVERLSDDLGLECLGDRREVVRRKQESPEEAARRVRRGFLLECASSGSTDRIALGHTLDDQAETVLMRLVRGAGATALTGMAQSGPGPFVRPLLGLERADLRAYLGRRDLAFRDDPSNRNLRFDRNRTRRLVLPVLAEVLNPRAARHLVKAADLLREDALYLDRLAEGELSRVTERRASGGLDLDCERLARAPRPIAQRVARRALQEAGADSRRLAARHVEALLDLATGPRGRRIHLPGRLEARRAGGRILIRPRPVSS